MEAPPKPAPSLLPARFAPDLEGAFQARYYADVRGTLRGASLLLALLFLAYVARDYLDTRSLPLVSRQNGAPAAFFLLVFGLSFWRGFGRVWQPVVAAAGWAAAALALSAMASFFAGAVGGGLGPEGPPPGGMAGGAPPPLAPAGGSTPFPGPLLFFSLQACVLMAALATLRLPFRWALAMQAGVLGVAAWAFTARMLGPGSEPWSAVFRLLQSTILVLVAVLLAAFIEERLARGAFLANHLLDREKDDERRKREQTEATLRVLGQAIGGIVHDLGNPLTTVQGGAQTLRAMAGEGQADPETVEMFSGMIEDGAQVLNYLRLSLMEETRVLEGKPTPVELTPTPVRPLVEAGARYQKPRVAAGREVAIDGDEAVQVQADVMKMVIVFMNMIGNALKYSDGGVRVAWQPSGGMLLIGVLDRGTGGKGITRAQAEKLFSAFGRLEAHAQIEGTGLGLLSVRKVAEAHGGEAFIQGYSDGTPGSPPFSTAAAPGAAAYPSLLSGEFRTAFVVTCPLSPPVAPGEP